VWKFVCQCEENVLRLLGKMNYLYTVMNLIIIVVYFFPKIFFFYCNNMKAKHWIVGMKCNKIVTEFIYIYIYIYIHTYIHTYKNAYTYFRFISQKKLC